MPNPKNKDSKHASMPERGSEADLATRVSRLEADMAAMKAEKQFEAFRRDALAGVEQIDLGKVHPWDPEGFWARVKAEVERQRK